MIIMTEVFNEPVSCYEGYFEPRPLLYRRRYFLLLLVSFQYVLGYWMYMTYAVDTGTIVYFYETSNELVDFITSANAVAYAILGFPAVWLSHKVGLSRILITSASFNAVCACLRFASLANDSFYFVLLGNCFLVAANTLTLALPAKFAAVWFGVSERATATATLILMQFVGGGISWLVTSFLVGTTTQKKVIRRGLYNIYVSQMASSLLCLVSTYLLIKERPPTPPSLAVITKEETKHGFKIELYRLLRSKNYYLHSLAFAINYATSMSFVVGLSQFVLIQYHDYPHVSKKSLGIAGMVTYATSIIGSLAIGRAQDKCKNYRLLLLIIVGTTLLSVTGTAACLFFAVNFYIFSTILWITAAISSGYLNFGLELIAEISHPSSEEIACMIPLELGNLLAFIIIHTLQAMLDHGLINPALLLGPVLSMVMLTCAAFAKVPIKRTEDLPDTEFVNYPEA